MQVVVVGRTSIIIPFHVGSVQSCIVQCHLTEKTIWTMASAFSVRSQLICGIFVFVSLIIQCDGQSNCDPGKVFDYDINSCMIMIIIIVIIINIRR